MTEIIVTGGTFDKDYLDSGELDFTDETSVEEVLKIARVMGCSVNVLMLMDSLFMTDEHREAIAKACFDSRTSEVVVTHGTDTMVATAQHIAEQSPRKPVVLTGAMRPYRLGNSDAQFNLGAAIAYARTSPPGTYIAMNGQRFGAHNVFKNRETGTFDRLK